MKYKPKEYAEALVELFLAKGADEREKEIAANFVKFIKKNGDEGKADKIILYAKDLFIKKTGRRKITLETARKIKPFQKEFLDFFIQKGDIVEEKINKELIAGIKIIIDNQRQLDASMLKKINNIFQ
jgi:F0F1-type ATP synthase delta subunit